MNELYKNIRISIFLLSIIFTLILGSAVAQQYLPLVPFDKRGNDQYKREGTHDANNIRTVFYNFGMVGDYPPDPINVDLSVFHSVEVPKGSGENYSDGTTPFVLAKITQRNGKTAYIMETGYRERQGQSPFFNRVMRFEPRPGYFQLNTDINKGLSPALSNDPRTWPDEWIDKINDPDDPGWKGSWDGYFGKAPRADQESFVVYDDQYYDAWDYFPDSRDAGQDPLNRRRGLGLRVEQRGFQWSNVQSSNVIFFHYDISNEGTSNYDDNIIFGLYMDSGVGGSGIGQDGIPESDDDNAFYDKSAGINLVYTWDNYGHGQKGKTGYLGYSYLETPGNPTDGVDNDQDGVTDEKRDSGPGQEIVGQDNIKAYVQSHYDLSKFEVFYGPLEERLAYKEGIWWTGDEDMDWVAKFHDTGADGVFDTHDTGELDGIPTDGEPNFDKTDVDESDQIGLTGFKMNRIRAGNGIGPTDNIVFFDNELHWPQRLYDLFTNPDSSFDRPLVLNYNIGFLFASGTFTLPAGKRERFSLALGFGGDLRELGNTTRVVQQIYKSNYQFAQPPPMPTLQAFTGDHYVTLTWDNKAEVAFDQLTNTNDFEGYRIYRSTDPTFLDPRIINTGTGSGPIGNGRPIAQYDLIDDVSGFSNTTVEGVAYFYGTNTGLSHSFTDTTVTNGQTYYYAVTAYDKGSDSLVIYPSENSIAVSQTLRGGIILPKNVVQVIPNAPALGYEPAESLQLQHNEGRGSGNVEIKIKNSVLVPDNHNFKVIFFNLPDTVRAQYYSLIDETAKDTLFSLGYDLQGEEKGPVGEGILPVISTPKVLSIDTLTSGFTNESNTNLKLSVRYADQVLPITLRRPGFPDDIEIIFDDSFLDTSIAAIGMPAKPTKFKVVAKTLEGDMQLNFRFFDKDNSNNLSSVGDFIEVLTYTKDKPTTPKPTWHIEVANSGEAIKPPKKNDLYMLNLKVPYSKEDVFTFSTKAQKINQQKAKEDFAKHPYVVPNPYVGAASFEPQRFAVSGRGERRIEFRGLTQSCTIRIYTINGELVKTIIHEGTMNEGFEAWDLRTKDNLEVAPGLYIFQVESKDVGTYIGKFAIIK